MSCGEDKIVKSRKPHLCESCGRVIPKGTEILNHHGIDSNEFFHWYECLFCMKNIKDRFDENWDRGEPFLYWFQEQEFKCPNCGKVIMKYSFDKNNNRYLKLKCEDCGRAFSLFVGYGLKEEK